MLPSSNSHRPTGSLTAVDAALMAVLFFLTLAVYGPVVHFPFISFDDPLYVSENPHVLSGLSWKNVLWTLTANAVGNWQPVTLLSYLVDIRAFGPAPGPIHLENALLHAMNAAGWFSLLQLMTGRRAASFFIGAFFAVHPAHVESVAWIAERKDVLSMCFMILSLFAYWRYTQRPACLLLRTRTVVFCIGADGESDDGHPAGADAASGPLAAGARLRRQSSNRGENAVAAAGEGAVYSAGCRRRGNCGQNAIGCPRSAQPCRAFDRQPHRHDNPRLHTLPRDGVLSPAGNRPFTPISSIHRPARSSPAGFC